MPKPRHHEAKVGILLKFSRDTVAQVLAAIDIVEVIGARLSLKPSGGSRFKGLSPFTNEKTPSFIVSRDRQMYHCFSSGKGGDALTFLMEYEGLSFSEALRKLADQAGIRLAMPSEGDDREEYQRGQLLELGKVAADFYRRQLLDRSAGEAGRAYLEKRKIGAVTAEKFGVGYAPDAWTNLYDAAVHRQYKDHVLEASGLFRRGERSDRGMYDFFRNRLIFPIRDVSGNVVAFGGRDLGDSPAKYINSPETPVYKKARVLYGLYEARDAMRREKYAILVEGYFDLIRCFDGGVENVVASCGTALTEQQAALIRRYVPEVVVVYDGDSAGIKAALKGTSILTAAGLRVRALALPDGKDPDDFVRDCGADAFRALLASAPDFLTFYVDMTRDRTETVEGRSEVAHELFQILRGMADKLRVDEYLRLIARALGLHEWACRREYEQFCRGAEERGGAARNPAAVSTVEDRPHKDDVDFIAALMAFPAMRRPVSMALAELMLPESPLAEALAWVLAQPDECRPAEAVADLENEAARRLLSAAALTEAQDEDWARNLVGRRSGALSREALRAETERVLDELRRAERDGDSARILELLRARTALSIRLDKLSVS